MAIRVTQTLQATAQASNSFIRNSTNTDSKASWVVSGVFTQFLKCGISRLRAKYKPGFRVGSPKHHGPSVPGISLGKEAHASHIQIGIPNEIEWLKKNKNESIKKEAHKFSLKQYKLVGQRSIIAIALLP